LRLDERRLLNEGKTDAEVREFMVSRYGDFVLYRPPVKPTTWLLWAGPFVLVIAGLALLIAYLRRRGREVHDTLLSADESRRADALLKDENP
jgi:cytochrome c-type biogenesis protein CcmH